MAAETRTIAVPHAVAVMINAVMQAATLHTLAFGFAKMTGRESS